MGGGDSQWSIEGAFSHAAAYRRHPGFRLTACVEPNADRRRAFMATWEVDLGFASLGECLSAGHVFDVASVCTPTQFHVEALRSLLDTPTRAVLCEKPLTDDPTQSDRLVEAYRDAGRLLAVDYPKRYLEGVAALKGEFDAGAWGQVRTVTGFYTKGIRNNGSHLLNLLQYFLGPLHAEGVVNKRIDDSTEDPTIDAVLRTDDGIPIHLIGADRRDFVLSELSFVTEQGVATIEHSGHTIRRRRREPHPFAKGYMAIDRGEWFEEDKSNGIYPVIENLFAAIDQGSPLVSDGADAAVTDALCNRLLELMDKD